MEVVDVHPRVSTDDGGVDDGDEKERRWTIRIGRTPEHRDKNSGNISFVFRGRDSIPRTMHSRREGSTYFPFMFSFHTFITPRFGRVSESRVLAGHYQGGPDRTQRTGFTRLWH